MAHHFIGGVRAGSFVPVFLIDVITLQACLTHLNEAIWPPCSYFAFSSMDNLTVSSSLPSKIVLDCVDQRIAHVRAAKILAAIFQHARCIISNRRQHLLSSLVSHSVIGKGRNDSNEYLNRWGDVLDRGRALDTRSACSFETPFHHLSTSLRWH